MTTTPDSASGLKQSIAEEPALLLWFSGPNCGVCHALWPRIEALLEAEFPRVARQRVDIAVSPDIAAEFGVFSIPVAIFFFDGRETSRFVRNFSPAQVREALERPYGLFFDAE